MGQTMDEEKKELTLEENFARLEEIIGRDRKSVV